MSATDLVFPVICFSQDIFRVAKDFDTLTECTSYALKRGWYKDMLISDSTGRSLRVSSARKLHGVGRFWGYNIFFNQRIKVELNYDGEPFQLSVEDIRERILDSFEKWEGWEEILNFEDWKASIENARTMAEIIRLAAD